MSESRYLVRRCAGNRAAFAADLDAGNGRTCPAYLKGGDTSLDVSDLTRRILDQAGGRAVITYNLTEGV